MLEEFWKSRFANAWFSRSILSFSFRRTEMLRERGPTLAAFLYFACLFVAGPWTEDHLPWLMSTNLLSKIAFSRFKSMFFSAKSPYYKLIITLSYWLDSSSLPLPEFVGGERLKLTILVESFVLMFECFRILLLKFDSFTRGLSVKNWFDSGFHLEMGHVVAAYTIEEWEYKYQAELLSAKCCSHCFGDFQAWLPY